MMKKLILTLLYLGLASPLFATITERYVSDAGAGAADGTSEAAAMSFATFTDYMVTGGSFTAAAGDRFNIKGVITARTTTVDTWVNGGTATSPVVVRGYGTVISDGYQGRTGGNGALITTNMASWSYTTGRINMTGNFIILEALNVTGAASNPTLAMGTDSVVRGCKFAGTSTNAACSAVQAAARALLIDSDFSFAAASGGKGAVDLAAAGTALDSCRATVSGGATVPAVVAGSTSGTIIGNVISTAGGVGISVSATTSAYYIRSNTIVGNAGDGIDIVTGTTVLQRIVGNMITDNTGNGIDMVSAANAGAVAYNRLRDNAASINSGTDWVAATSYGQSATDTGTTGTTATDYVNYAGGDYNIIFASPATNAGDLLYSTIGALQPQRSSSSAVQTARIYGQ